VTETLAVHILQEVSARFLPALDGVFPSVYLGFFHENILIPVVPVGLRVSWSVSGQFRPQHCRWAIVW